MIELRALQTGDVEALFEAVTESIPELSRWLPWCHPEYSREESRAWIELQIANREAGSEFAFAILSKSGRLLGCCGVEVVHKANRLANLGYWVRTSAAGSGVATEAVKAIARWAFENTNLNRLEILVLTDNHASERVAEKSGAQREGTLRARIFFRGKSNDALTYSIVRPSA